MADKYLDGIKAGSTGVSIHVLLRKKADNTELIGVLFSAATAAYCRQGATAQPITLVTQTMGSAWASGGFIEVSAALMPGLYRLDLPDAAVAAGADFVSLAVVTATGYCYLERVPLSTQTVQSGDNYARIGAPTAASIAADLAVIAGYVDSLEARTPAALIGGRMDASTGAMQANVMTAAATAADFVSEIAGLDPVALRAALGLAIANLDAQFAASPAAVLAAAAATPIASNMKKTNNVPVIGTGIPGDKFRGNP